MCKTIVAEAEELVLKELNRSVKPSVIPPSILERSKDQYQNRLKQLLKEAGDMTIHTSCLLLPFETHNFSFFRCM